MATKTRATLNAPSIDESWEVQRDLETLIECEKIEKDPKRLKAAQDLAKKRMLEIAAVAAEGSTD